MGEHIHLQVLKALKTVVMGVLYLSITCDEIVSSDNL